MPGGWHSFWPSRSAQPGGIFPTVLFGPSDVDHKIIIIATITGVLSSTFVLGPIPSIGILYCLPIVIGCMIALSLQHGTYVAPLMLLLAVHTASIITSRRLLDKLAAHRIADHVRVDEQNDTIGLLMRDTEGVGSDWLFEIDSTDRMRGVSARLALAANVPAIELEGAPFRHLFANHLATPSTAEGIKAVLDAMAKRRAFHDFVVTLATPSGPLWWQLTGKPVHDKLGTFIGYRGVGVDVTAARIAEERIAYLASYDVLTGLANRDMLQTRTALACEAAVIDRGCRALLYLDLDGFKLVNDTHGHAAGDDLLRQVAQRLNAAVPAKAIVGRLGGDEFAVLCQFPDPSGGETLAKTIVAALAMPFAIDNMEVMIGASVGIAITPHHATEADALLVKADLALYRAKAEGKGRHRMFVAAYEQSLIEKRLLEEDLKLALARREFQLFYQPLVDLSTGRVTSFEALIRWFSPTRGRISPDAFIPASEATGLIVPIGRWVLSEACREAARWDPGIAIAVNISPQHFRSPDFVQDVVSALALSGLHAARVEIEITEGVFLEHSKAAIDNLHALRRRGVRIALDDFGTGFSSLNYLVKFPVDKIKIDRSFVRDIVDRHESRSIVEAILTLAKKLSIRVTAEGVETIEQALALKLLRCDTIQGYLMNEPKPAGEIDMMIAVIPKRFEAMIPMLFVSPLALALAVKKQTIDLKPSTSQKEEDGLQASA